MNKPASNSFDNSDELERPPTPPGLNAGGRALWNGVLNKYALRIDEWAVLEAAARELDLLHGMQARLEEDLAAGEWTVKGSMGQPVSHPLIAELRQHRTVLANLLRRLGLSEADDEVAGARQTFTRSEIGRLAARARWGN